MKNSECQQAEQHPSLTHLFTSFLRLGATAFGGPAMIAYIRKMAVDQKRWLDEKAARDGIALCQTIPGATAMQMSAYIGFRARGVGGPAASFIGFGLPAFLFMMNNTFGVRLALSQFKKRYLTASSSFLSNPGLFSILSVNASLLS